MQTTATPIYQGYDQAGLDAQYNNRLRWPDYKVHFANWREWSQRTCAELPCHLDLAFGPGPMEKLDILPAAQSGAPLYVFIHGGYWYSLDKADYSYVAEGFRPHGITTAVNNFGLAPDTSMDEIVRQNRAALAWLWRNARAYGADPERIYVCGHSAGGHLVAMLLATDWPAFGAGLPKDVVKGACSIGGLFDMEAIRLSFLNKTLKMSREEAARNAPLAQTYPVRAPLSLVVAVDETPEYHRQSQAMADLWRSLGYPVELLVPEGLNHFDVVNQLRDPGCELVKVQLAEMRKSFTL
ncbi:MAG: alpha/beta hydrolase [Betaproteobacteria bacterium]